jgi:hypothetical protein
MSTPEPITKKRLLVVEGEDEINFFEKLLKYINMTDLVDIREVGGKAQFKNKMPVLQKASGFNKLEHIAIIRDADENAAGAFASIVGIINNIGLTPPGKAGQFSSSEPRVGIFIMPDNASKGMLEDLCLRTVEDCKVIECVSGFFDCVKEKELKHPPKNLSKAKAQAFLAAMPEIANSVGVGALKGYWGFDSEELKPLIHFLGQLK